MRPDSIKKFDLFYLAALAISVVQALINYETLEAQLSQQLAASGFGGETGSLLPISLAIGIGISLLLWFLVSRLRQAWARWLVLLFVGYRVIMIPFALASGFGSLSITGIVGGLLYAISLWFLFQPDATRWLASREG